MNREQRLARVFVELADTMVDEFDVVEFLHTLTERTVELLDADAAGLILRDQRGHLQVVAFTSNEAQVLEFFELQSSEGPCLACLTSGEPVVNIDLAEVKTRWPHFHAATTLAGYQSTHALPLRLRDTVIGAMNLFCVGESTLNEDDVALGRALADIATIALLQERAVRQQGLLAEQLQHALDSRILIEQAKGAMAERAQVEIDEAFQMIRAYSRRNRQTLTNVAMAVINGSLDTAELLTNRPGSVAADPMTHQRGLNSPSVPEPRAPDGFREPQPR